MLELHQNVCLMYTKEAFLVIVETYITIQCVPGILFWTDAQIFEAVALYDFEGRTGRELSFKKHDTLLVYHRVSQDWWEGLYQGREGLIPDRYICLKHP